MIRYGQVEETSLRVVVDEGEDGRGKAQMSKNGDVMIGTRNDIRLVMAAKAAGICRRSGFRFSKCCITSAA
jgi:hypothetical protein